MDLDPEHCWEPTVPHAPCKCISNVPASIESEQQALNWKCISMYCVETGTVMLGLSVQYSLADVNGFQTKYRKWVNPSAALSMHFFGPCKNK